MGFLNGLFGSQSVNFKNKALKNSVLNYSKSQSNIDAKRVRNAMNTIIRSWRIQTGATPNQVPMLSNGNTTLKNALSARNVHISNMSNANRNAFAQAAAPVYGPHATQQQLNQAFVNKNKLGPSQYELAPGIKEMLKAKELTNNAIINKNNAIKANTTNQANNAAKKAIEAAKKVTNLALVTNSKNIKNLAVKANNAAKEAVAISNMNRKKEILINKLKRAVASGNIKSIREMRGPFKTMLKPNNYKKLTNREINTMKGNVLVPVGNVRNLGVGPNRSNPLAGRRPNNKRNFKVPLNKLASL
jgi:hypothetical protein